LKPEGSGQTIPAFVSALEVVSIVTSILVVIWGIVPLMPRSQGLMAIPLLLVLTQSIVSHCLRQESLAEIGLSTRNFGEATALLRLPLLFCSGLLIFAGWASGSLETATGFFSGLPSLLVSGIAQQYLLQGVIHRRLGEATLAIRQRFSTLQSTLPVLLTATCFAVVHLPNITLSILTFIGGLILSLVYQRAPNIYAIGLSHGFMSLIVIKALPPWILHSLSVGYKHFLYQYYR